MRTHRHAHMPSALLTCTSVLRLLVIALGVALYSQSAYVNSLLQGFWTRVRASRIVQHDSFEPVLVIVAFAVWHLLFYAADSLLFDTLRSWRIQSSDDLRHWKFEGGHRFRGEAMWYLAPLLALDAIFPRRKLPEAAPTVERLGLEVLAALLVYDVLFFAAHLAFHKVPYLFRNVHAKHHTKTVQRASETLRLSLPEVVADTLCSVAALNIVRAHPLSRAVYNVVITYLITELHSGYDAPWMLQNLVPCGLWGGSRRHDEHHRLGSRYYQKFFTFLDDGLEQWRKRSQTVARHTEAVESDCCR